MVGWDNPTGPVRSHTQASPSAPAAASLGCGSPLAVADLAPGERVLDLGSGGGIDVLLSARRVGPTGFDMTAPGRHAAIIRARKP